MSDRNEQRIEEFRRVGRGVILTALCAAVLFGVLALAGDWYHLHGELDELRGFRAGIPATMLPSDRPRFSAFPITYKGQKMTARRYPSSSKGTAANADYFVIINAEGIVEAAFSSDVPEGAEWASRYREE